MLSRYQIKSTQSSYRNRQPSQSNRMLSPPSPILLPPLARNLSALCSYMENVNIYWYTKTLLHSLHPIAPTKHKHSTQWVVPIARRIWNTHTHTRTYTRSHTLSVSHLKYEWWFYFTYIQPSIIIIIIITIMKWNSWV